MCAGRRQWRNGHRKCCSDVVHDRRVAPRTAGISARKQQPAGNRQQGNPAPGPTEHGKQDSLAYTGSVAEQVTTSAAAFAMPGWCAYIAWCPLLCVQRRSARTVVAEGDLRSHRSVENYSSPGGTRWTRGPLPLLRAIERLNAAAATDSNRSDRLPRQQHASDSRSLIMTSRQRAKMTRLARRGRGLEVTWTAKKFSQIVF